MRGLAMEQSRQRELDGVEAQIQQPAVAQRNLIRPLSSGIADLEMHTCRGKVHTSLAAAMKLT